MEHTNTSEKPQLEIIEKVPTDILQIPLKLYSESTAMETYVKIPFLLIGVLFLIHNIFLAGRSFAYNTYETIKTVELSIVGVIVIVVFVIAGIAINKNSKVNKHLKEISKKYNIILEITQDEFSALAIHMYGGRGVKLKK
ncbi:hypothetical protein [Aquimarina sp. I32.4]|uniref:hypothetical protein n=1 Tax=Aquimarina sp. I32.4 TaxID=2053903 RepID=UPI000CDEF0C9|nr:hypothetical protein [Aquimarina sp. I32.4]